MLIEAWARRMYFVPERQHDSSQALACPQWLPTLTGPLLNSDFSTASTFNPGLGCIYTEGLPRRGYRTQPGFQPGFNPGNLHNKRFALKLTRRYLVAPCWKNTRSAGLEVLKGREMRVPDEART
ncbi:MAG: hypothetical protein QOG92_1564, partial [Verrucomicrobiota bacterium]|nr:hypothetical protein [Verrucomicrobiota bacterium]